MAETDREENINPDTEGEEIVIEGPEEEKKQEDVCTEQEESCSAEKIETEQSDPAAEEADAGKTGSEEPEVEASEEEGAASEEAGEDETEKESGSTDSGVRRRLEEEKLKSKIDELTDRLKRSLAEFDNFRKRTDKEKSSMYEIGARDIVEKILPVLDNFERGLASAPEGDKFAEGIQMIYKQLVTALTDAGVKPIEAVGKPFDPELHNAVMHVEDAELGENIVVEEFQKGYLYRDHVVRHSMVKVAN